MMAELQSAAGHLQNGDARSCQKICNELLKRNPGLLAAYNLRGLAAAQSGDPLAAIRDLERIWPAQPQNTQAALWLGRMYRLQGDYLMALAPLQAAAQEMALEADARYELARVLTRIRRSSEAMAEYQRILVLQPGHTDAAANLAFLLERANRLPEAEEMAGRALHSAPGNFMALLTKATLERRNGSPAAAQARIEHMLQQPQSPPISLLNRSILLNQLAQCLVAQHQYQAAFERYEQGNALLRQHHPLGKPLDEGSYGLHTIGRLQQWLREQPPAQWSKPSVDSAAPGPVFLLGFPRSGTTLLDQALSAHPDIEVLEEYEFFDEVRRNWVDGAKLEQLADLNASQLHSARQQYLAAMSARRQQVHKTRVVDKLPLNLLYLFLIHRLFPDAPVLFLVRDPRDVCLSCFFQSFELQGAMPYFLDLQQTAHYYAAAMSLARDSLQQISNPVFFQGYEKLVMDFEPSMRAILDFLDLPWSEEILQYRQKAQQRFIDTPSYQQVTRPLYPDSIGRWRQFSAQMEPLAEQLGPWIKHFGYPDK